MDNTVMLNADKLMHFFNLDDLKTNVEPSIQFLNKENVLSGNFIHQHFINNKLLSKISYKINNVGQRSEDFNQLDVKKTNILFAGCSVTFGEFLPEGYSWPHHVYKYFKDLNLDLGPLNIVSFPGASGPKIVYNIFKYLSNYGTPDYLFILMPDVFRYYATEKDAKSFYPSVPYIDGTEIKDSLDPFNRIYEFQQFYRMLEILCNLFGIKLYCSSWSNSANTIIDNFNFSTYKKMQYDYKKIIDGIDANYLKLYDKDFYIKAADDLHPGLFTQLTYAQYFIDRIKNDIKN
jgi:hypothetical protein